MATNIEFDAQNLVSNHFTLEVRISRVKQWQWRLNIALLLCRLAAKIAWLRFNVIRDPSGDPWLYYCQKCGREIAGHKPFFERYLVISCPHCRYQSLVVGQGDPEYITEDTFKDYVCDCHFAEPYGFVPEADCPVHDRA